MKNIIKLTCKSFITTDAHMFEKTMKTFYNLFQMFLYFYIFDKVFVNLSFL